MSAAQVAGLILLLSPFVAAFVVITREEGVWAAVSLFAMTAVISGVIMLGVWLLVGGS